MACPAILTGDDFLVRVLGHIDCQAQLIGSYGWQALGQPGSLTSIVMTGLLTLFVALFGIRLLFGPAPGARDVVSDVIKIGIVLTLAFSWPAFRTVIHDVVLDGPAEIARAAGSPVMPGEGVSFARQLQDADNAIVRLTEAGTGRNVGALVDDAAPGGTFKGSALEDENSFGWSRLVYLAGIFGSLALLRITAGVLLALAPLAAGLLLFEATRGIFSGWLRGLVLTLLASVGVTIALAAQLAIIGPWLADALRLRTLGYATPSAPIELFALTLAFAIVQFAMIWLLAKVAFTRGWITLPAFPNIRERLSPAPVNIAPEQPQALAVSRVQRIADSMETQIRREEHLRTERTAFRTLGSRSDGGSDTASSNGPVASVPPERLGSSWRRTSRRSSASAQRRDGKP
ncbi:hypothetical protein HME9302_00086 [Alteripontixanthobacter maritimus]|uniref:Type IV secretion system protein VirB6 n=1 Tax=Alteripontixanthobacter maritimus TaxID=2161824 RepID=A0A369Q367_9SPHN|nr:type IV secretion system protein [Alteripontixanthobacter maritimus]RDC58910.1 hypothetical protein HME9302_00086 [Alteripontixanthobacter maritimus]